MYKLQSYVLQLYSRLDRKSYNFAQELIYSFTNCTTEENIFAALNFKPHSTPNKNIYQECTASE